MTLLQKIYWFFYKLTPQGKTAWLFKDGFNGLKDSAVKKNATKKNVIGSATKKLKQKKILAFNKGRSITKSKKTDYQVMNSVKKEHAQELQERGIRITNNGRFKNA